jgi:hypothetical protein
MSAYIGLALEAAHHDATLRRHLMPVFNLTGPMSLFFEPRFAPRVLRASAERRVNRALRGSQPVPSLPPLPT